MRQIVKTFNNLINKTIFKVQNKTNNNFKISNFNKYLIIVFSLLFFYLFYLLIPTFYEKTWVQTNIESKLLNEFKLNLNTSADISYRILPSPHFLIKDSKISIKTLEKKSIAEIKNLKVFISQNNFFDKDRMNIKEVNIDDANFSLLRKDLTLLNRATDNKFSSKKIKIHNSNIFLNDNLGETIAIIKIFESLLFFDNQQLLNIFDLSGEVFNVPFKIKSESQINGTKNKKTNIKAKNLRLDIFNEFDITSKGYINGKNIISFLDSTINTKYIFKKKKVTFNSGNSKIKNSKINYSGELSINPFNLILDIDLGTHSISKLFNINPILNEFINTGLLFNDNISLKTSIFANSNTKDDLFQDAKINFHISNGKIDLDNTKFLNDKIGSLELKNSNFLFKNKSLILNTDVLIDIKSPSNLFSFFNTSKSSRKDFKKILVNLDYNFLSNQLKFYNVKIDNYEFSDQLLRITEGFEDNNINNIIKSRRLINELFSAYAG